MNPTAALIKELKAIRNKADGLSNMVNKLLAEYEEVAEKKPTERELRKEILRNNLHGGKYRSPYVKRA